MCSQHNYASLPLNKQGPCILSCPPTEQSSFDETVITLASDCKITSGKDTLTALATCNPFPRAISAAAAGKGAWEDEMPGLSIVTASQSPKPEKTDFSTSLPTPTISRGAIRDNMLDKYGSFIAIGACFSLVGIGIVVWAVWTCWEKCAELRDQERECGNFIASLVARVDIVAPATARPKSKVPDELELNFLV